MDLDLSLTMTPSEVHHLLDYTNVGNVDASSAEMSLPLGTSLIDTDRFKGAEDSAVKEKTEVLYSQFLEILHSRTNDSEVFDIIQDMIQACTDVLDEVVKSGRKLNEKYRMESNAWLQQERNTWRLLYCLYKDRLTLQKEDVDCDVPPLDGSEKDVVTHLYSNNANLREYQLIVDWLELCALETSKIQIGHFTDRTITWENTLLQLKNPEKTAFESKRATVTSLDPDAPIRERKPLHDLDTEDEARLSQQIFLEIRQGRIEEAQALCEHCGQPWRAAILEGWRLHEDPNYESSNVVQKLPIEGNPRRDIWKKCAWMMADSKKFDDYTRAIAGAYCGHLESLIGPVSNTWEDLLWAYLKVQIDIRVESEIRTCCMRNYLPLPDKYWNGKMSLEQIFDELAANKNISIRQAAKAQMRIIQKYLILDDIPEMMREIGKWLNEKMPAPHMLRFLSHVVLFMKQLGKDCQEDIADRVVKSYVECLIELHDPQLVAFYTAALPGDMQILLFSQYLETIKETSARKAALEEALTGGLDVETITTYTVETIRNRQDEAPEKQLQTAISPADEEKISALEWLTFYPQQRGELLWQTNAMIRTLLAEGKIECVRKAFKMVPTDSISQTIATYGSKDNLPCKEECSIKEYLCHQTYLAAIDGFNEWTHLYHNRPKQPQIVKDSANFTERVASEHKEQQYKIELDRWKMNLAEQMRITRDLLFNVLLFPDKGWLVDPDTMKDVHDDDLPAWENRLIQMENLRKVCIPEIVLLLHKVLHLSEDYKGCLRLADEIASEQRQLYAVYPKHKLAETLSKIAESSLALMNEKLDPWGYVPTS